MAPEEYAEAEAAISEMADALVTMREAKTRLAQVRRDRGFNGPAPQPNSGKGRGGEARVRAKAAGATAAFAANRGTGPGNAPRTRARAKEPSAGVVENEVNVVSFLRAPTVFQYDSFEAMMVNWEPDEDEDDENIHEVNAVDLFTVLAAGNENASAREPCGVGQCLQQDRVWPGVAKGCAGEGAALPEAPNRDQGQHEKLHLLLVLVRHNHNRH